MSEAQEKFNSFIEGLNKKGKLVKSSIDDPRSYAFLLIGEHKGKVLINLTPEEIGEYESIKQDFFQEFARV